jgi:hypothetical protein
MLFRAALRRATAFLGSTALFACAAASIDSEGEDGRACEAEPLGHLTAFLEEPAPPLSARLTGTVVTSSPGPAPDEYRYVIRDAAGSERRLTYRAPGGPLPVKVGTAYEFQVDHVGGAPPASGLLIQDRSGLVFAGATDQRLGSHVLKDGLPDLALSPMPPACPSRPTGTCFEAIRNQPLRATYSGRSVDLVHGQSARLGPYRITCLTAQSVTYRPSCADAGLPAVSYLVVRVD